MCGLAGILSRSGGALVWARLVEMTRAVRHRGPDDRGFLCHILPDGSTRIARDSDSVAPGSAGPLVALGHRRLSVIDVSSAGWQPMVTGDQRYALIFNGEIYNFLTLRRELEDRGHHFESRSDTEVLLKGYVEWGPALFPRLEGMFAFALLDRPGHRLVLARDRFGIKPLYWAESPDGLAFASEIPSLLLAPGVSRRVDPQRLHTYLDQLDTDDQDATLFRDVKQLRPGTWMRVPLDLVRPPVIERFAEVHGAPPGGLTFEAAADELRRQLLDSVRLHLQSDVRVGFALSGGLDSSSVTVSARQVMGPDAVLDAFVFIPDDPRLSEERFARSAQVRAGATLHPVRVTAGDVRDDFAAVHQSQGEPFHGPTIYVQRRIFARAAEVGVKVVLEGQGGDEMLAGYDRYVVARVGSLLAAGDLPGALRMIRTVPWRERPGLLRGGAWIGSPASLRALLRRLRRHPQGGDGVIRWEWFDARGARRAPRWDAAGPRLLIQYLTRSLTHSPLQALLRYGDRNAMASSVENRVPLLHRPLTEFALSLPEEYLLAWDGTRKAVLRRAMQGLVPDDILARRDKVGFAVPVSDWLLELEPWVNQKLRAAGALPFLDSNALSHYWDRFRSRPTWRGAFPIWRWMGLATWAEIHGVVWE